MTNHPRPQLPPALTLPGQPWHGTGRAETYKSKCTCHTAGSRPSSRALLKRAPSSRHPAAAWPRGHRSYAKDVMWTQEPSEAVHRSWGLWYRKSVR